MTNSPEQRRDMILNGPIFKSIVRLSLPLMFGNLIQTLYNLADAFWVGNKVGYQAFAAIGYVWPITFIFLSFSIGLTVAATSLISQSVGKNEYDKANRILGQFFNMSLILGVAFCIIGYLLTPAVIGLMGAEGELYRMSVDYLQIIFLEIPLLFLFHVYKAMEESQGNTLSPTIVLVISVIANVILDPIFIVTLGMGVKGAAWATVLSRLLIAGFLFRKMFERSSLIHISTKYLSLDFPVLKIYCPSQCLQHWDRQYLL